MNMTDYLKDFFAEDASRKAAVPGLGVFYAEAGTDGRYRILFEEVAPKGKDFINHVAFRMNGTEQEAVEKLDEWVKDILKSLKSIKVATLPGIGTFEVSDGKVNFLPSAEQDTEDRFGLEPIAAASSRQGRTEEEVGETPDSDDLDEDTRFEDEMEQAENMGGEYHKDLRKKRQAMLMWVGVGGCIVILLAVMLLIFKPFPGATGKDAAVIEDIILGESTYDRGAAPVTDPVETRSTVNEKSCEDAAIEEAFKAGEREKRAAEAQARREQAAKPAAKPVAKPEPKPKPAAKPAPAKPAATKPVAKTGGLAEGVNRPELGKFYIIVGSYANLDNARRVYGQLAQTGTFNARILFDAQKNIYKVSIKEFYDKGAAIRFKNELRSGAGMDGWIYEHK